MHKFVIILNDIRGVDLVLKRLRESGCIASADLADGIENNLFLMDEKGNLESANPPDVAVVEPEPVTPPVTAPKKSHPFTVIQGGKTKH